MKKNTTVIPAKEEIPLAASAKKTTGGAAFTVVSLLRADARRCISAFAGMTLLFIILLASTAHAIDETETGGEGGKTGSGLPIPRFASLRTSDVNLRTGPGTRYPIDWVFTHQGMPVEITAEYQMWRRVRDVEGDEGWVHKNALSGKRGAIVTGGARELRRDPDANAATVAHLEAGAVGQLVSCTKDWCKLKFEGTKGYLPKSDFWGAYQTDNFD